MPDLDFIPQSMIYTARASACSTQPTPRLVRDPSGPRVVGLFTFLMFRLRTAFRWLSVPAGCCALFRLFVAVHASGEDVCLWTSAGMSAPLLCPHVPIVSAHNRLLLSAAVLRTPWVAEKLRACMPTTPPLPTSARNTTRCHQPGVGFTFFAVLSSLKQRHVAALISLSPFMDSSRP